MDYPTPDGTCIRDYIHIIDLAQATHARARARLADRASTTLGNGDGYSVRQVIQTCEKVSGKKIPVIEKPRRPGDAPKLVAAAGKAISELGWKPKYSRSWKISSPPPGTGTSSIRMAIRIDPQRLLFFFGHLHKSSVTSMPAWEARAGSIRLT